MSYRREAYITLIMSYVNDFALKHGFIEDDDILRRDCLQNGIVEIGDCYFDIEDIMYDIDYNIPENKIIQWYDYNLQMVSDGYRNVNYKSYLMGFRHKERGIAAELWYKLLKRLFSVHSTIRFRTACLLDPEYRKLKGKAKEFIKEYV